MLFIVGSEQIHLKFEYPKIVTWKQDLTEKPIKEQTNCQNLASTI